MSGFICGPRLYEYDGWFFAVHSWCGPWPLKKDGDPKAKAGRKFWKMISKFDKLTDKQKLKFRCGGGCVQF